jgi:hypothetical protein
MMGPVDLKPLLISRVAGVLGWLGLGALAVGYLVGRADRPPVVYVAVGACVAISLYLAVRAYRMGAHYGPEGIEVRGFVLSRRIPKARITEVTTFPAVRWQSDDGKARWSPIFAFFDAGEGASFLKRHNKWAIERLQDWDGRRRGTAGRKPSKRRRRPVRSDRG